MIKGCAEIINKQWALATLLEQKFSWTWQWSDAIIYTQHPQPQCQQLLVKIFHRRVWCASGAANTRSDCHTIPTMVQMDQWLLMLTFIRLYWSSCIDIDTQMRHPSTSRANVSIILTECMQHTASHDSRLFFSVYFLSTLTNSLEFCFITKHMQSSKHPALGSSQCCSL